MTSKTQLQQEIKNLETKLSQFKEQLGSYKTFTIEDAKVGDTLEDGSIVLSKSNGIALLVAPKSTEVVEAEWSKEFPEVFKSLKNKGFNPSQWFVPTKEQLKLAYKVIPGEFSCDFYWSSTETNATYACNVSFNLGGEFSPNKTTPFCVRAFRCVTF